MGPGGDGQAADLELAEGLGEGGEDPEDEDGVQDGHRQHQGDASCGCEVINGSHIRGDVQGAHGHKVGRTQSHDLPARARPDQQHLTLS